MSSYISVKHISKSFNNKKILNDISFYIKKGSVVGLLGPNGSGKTTMIRILNGVIKADEGDILIDGMNPINQGDSIRKKVGIVTESASLYHELSAYDNLKFYADIYGVTDKNRVDELLEKFDMTDYKDQLVGTFSTGMKKRIALAKAMLHSPEILYLDEPTNGLDPEGIKMVIKYLEKINKEDKITILICSHVLHQLETICDSYLFIQDGFIIESGTISELENKYLTNITVKVETDLQPTENTYHGNIYERTGEKELSFSLASMDDIPSLLKKISAENRVFSCHIANRDLESLYFKIRGEKDA